MSSSKTGKVKEMRDNPQWQPTMLMLIITNFPWDTFSTVIWCNMMIMIWILVSIIDILVDDYHYNGQYFFSHLLHMVLGLAKENPGAGKPRGKFKKNFFGEIFFCSGKRGIYKSVFYYYKSSIKFYDAISLQIQV